MSTIGTVPSGPTSLRCLICVSQKSKNRHIMARMSSCRSEFTSAGTTGSETLRGMQACLNQYA